MAPTDLRPDFHVARVALAGRAPFGPPWAVLLPMVDKDPSRVLGLRLSDPGDSVPPVADDARELRRSTRGARSRADKSEKGGDSNAANAPPQKKQKLKLLACEKFNAKTRGFTCGISGSKD